MGRPGRPHSVDGASRPLVLAVVLGVAALIALGAFFAWNAWRDEPQASVALMGHAYTSHDWERFRRYVDVEAVVDSGIEQLLPEELQGEGVLGLLTESVIEAQKPRIVEQVRERLRSAVESGDARDSWFREQRGMFAFRRAEVLEREGDTARVRLDTGERYGEVELVMERRGRRWVVVEVANIGQVLERAGLR